MAHHEPVKGDVIAPPRNTWLGPPRCYADREVILMTRRWLLWIVALLLVAAACAPAPTVVPARDPVFFAATPIDVAGSVIQAISTSPGLDDSTGWMITQADTQGGFVRAETEVRVPGGFFRRMTTRSEFVSVVVAPAGETRTQVVIQHTNGATELAERIMRELRAEYGLN
jgi:hypothetical protein